jgi:hypothetical protein
MQGKDDDRRPTLMWATRGEEQLAKCAEAQMLRTVAPEECAGLYIGEEVNDIISKEEQAPSAPVTPAVIPQAVIAPAVNQTADAKVEEVPAWTPQPPPAPDSVHGFVMVPTVVPEPSQERIQTTPFPPVQPSAVVIVPPPPAPVAASAVSATDKPATAKEVAEFLARAAKIVRDKLPQAGLKDAEASSTVKNYILKASGKTTFRAIPAAVFNKLLKVLEDAATPADAAAIAKAGCK